MESVSLISLRVVSATMLLLCFSHTLDAAMDCSRPKSSVERLMCSNDRVSEAHQRMAFAFLLAYRRTTNEEKREVMRQDQRKWETDVRDACVDVACLIRVHDERTVELEQN